MTERRTVRRVLVTGASGFVGRSLCEELVRHGTEVVAAARNTAGDGPYEWLHLELPAPLPTAALDGVDTVFHLAARTHAVAETKEDRALYELVNREGTRQVARAAAAAGVERFVLMSSVKAMRTPGTDIVREDDDTLPSDPYGLSKRQAEKEAFEAGAGTMDVVALRPALIYGPGVKGNFASLIEVLRSGRTPPLPHISNRRSLIGLRDLMACTLLAARLDSARGRTYVVTDGHAYSTERIIRALAAALGVESEPRFRIPLPVLRVGARLGDRLEGWTGRRLPLDTAVLQRLLGNAEYESLRAENELGFSPADTLEGAASQVVGTYTRPPSGKKLAGDPTL